MSREERLALVERTNAEVSVNHKAVARHLQEMGLRAIYPEPNQSKRKHAEAVYPYLLRGLDITRPNQVWFREMGYSQNADLMLRCILDASDR